ncbi:MAG: dienelactone hydrolase family protein [Phocaeicola sp.]
MKTNIVSLLLSLFFFTSLFAQNSYERCLFISAEGDSLNYRLLRPEGIQQEKKYPLVLFLHGAGERGSDNQKQLTHGGGMWLNPVNREKYPAFVLVPQCPESGYWAYFSRPKSFVPDEMPLDEPITPLALALKELLDSFLGMPQVDKERIYIVGLSMGAMATYDIVIRYPDTFAAAVPICGTVNPARLGEARSVKFRIYHGDDDNVVPVEGSREAYKALKSAGAEVDYIEFPGINHGSWTAAFNDQMFMEWIFSQKK